MGKNGKNHKLDSKSKEMPRRRWEQIDEDIKKPNGIIHPLISRVKHHEE